MSIYVNLECLFSLHFLSLVKDKYHHVNDKIIPANKRLCRVLETEIYTCKDWDKDHTDQLCDVHVVFVYFVVWLYLCLHCHPGMLV